MTLPDFRSIDPGFFDRLRRSRTGGGFPDLARRRAVAGRPADLALAAAERAVSLAPRTMSEALTNLAVLQARRGDYLPAARRPTTGAGIEPDDPVLHYNRGRL